MKKNLHKAIIIIFCASLFTTDLIAAAIIPTGTVILYENAEPVMKPKIPIAEVLAEFKSLSRKEKKERIKEVKKELKEFKKQKKAGAEPSTNTLLLVILAILLPPLAVYLHEGVINNKFWISLVLTLLFWIPGVIYALVVVLDKD